VLIGIGVAGTLDEVVLHQVLGWHHFYDRSTPSAGLLALAAAVALTGALLLRRVRQPRSRQETPVGPAGS
jgi:uncharacterized membrane protein